MFFWTNLHIQGSKLIDFFLLYIPLTQQPGGESTGKVYDLIMITVLYCCYDMEIAS